MTSHGQFGISCCKIVSEDCAGWCSRQAGHDLVPCSMSLLMLWPEDDSLACSLVFSIPGACSAFCSRMNLHSDSGISTLCPFKMIPSLMDSLSLKDQCQLRDEVCCVTLATHPFIQPSILSLALSCSHQALMGIHTLTTPSWSYSTAHLSLTQFCTIH